MRVYVVTKETNLVALRDNLVPKYKDLVVEGTNDIHTAFTEVSKMQVIKPYDVMIVMNDLVKADLSSQLAITKDLNRNSVYALKNLPIYIMLKSGNEEHFNHIKKNVTASSVRIWKYERLTIQTLEQVIKEVLTHGNKVEVDASVAEDIIAEKNSKVGSPALDSVNRIYAKKRQETDADFRKLSNVTKIIEKFSNPDKQAHVVDNHAKNANTIEMIKNMIFVEQPKTMGSTVTVDSVNKLQIDKSLALENIKEQLKSTNQDYVDHLNYMDTLTDIIEKVKTSDEPDKGSIVIDLLKEKASSNETMFKIISDFVSLVSVDITKEITETYTNELAEFGDFLNVDNLINENLGDINKLKTIRTKLKDNSKVVTHELSATVNSVNNALSTVANQYLLTNNEISKEMESYANEHNVIITKDNFIMENKLITTNMEEAYDRVKLNVNSLITASTNAISALVEVAKIDEEIIEKQDQVINTLVTQKTVKTIVVDDVVKSKLHVIIGANGTGKTLIGSSLAKTFARYGKTLLVDLNLENPNLRYYNTSKNGSTSEWFNKSTISMENFIRVPLGNTMYKQLPFNDNLTIIQPLNPIDLADYERVISPGVFALHLLSFIEDLANFYDRIVVILSEDLSNYTDLIPKIGYLYAVTDSDISNSIKLKESITIHSQLQIVPVKTFILNKSTRGIPLSEKDIMAMCGANEEDYKLFIIPSVTDAVSMKYKGDMSLDFSSPLGSRFHDLYRG